MNKETAIKTAAKWWADKLRGGNPDIKGADTPTDDQLAVFTAELESMIPKFMDVFDILHDDIHHPTGTVVTMDCQFKPCAVLSKAAGKAGIDPFNFPFKEYTCIRKNGTNDYRFWVASGEPFKDGTGQMVQPCKEVEPYE